MTCSLTLEYMFRCPVVVKHSLRLHPSCPVDSYTNTDMLSINPQGVSTSNHATFSSDDVHFRHECHIVITNPWHINGPPPKVFPRNPVGFPRKLSAVVSQREDSFQPRHPDGIPDCMRYIFSNAFTGDRISKRGEHPHEAIGLDWHCSR